MLARVHTIPTKGHGHGDGRGRWLSWDTFLLDFLDNPAMAQCLERLRCSSGGGGEAAEVADVVEAAAAALRAGRDVLRELPARLVHHDYEPWHVFADATPGAERITGVIDHESCRGGDPAYDLAQWHVVHDVYAPVAPVVAGYRAAGGWIDSFETRLRLSLVHYRLNDLLHRICGSDAGDRPVAVDADVVTGARRLANEVARSGG